MPITHARGCTVFTGDSINYFQLCVRASAVKLECAGITVRRGPKVWKQVAREFGIKGKREDVLKWLLAKIEELRPQQEHIVKK